MSYKPSLIGLRRNEESVSDLSEAKKSYQLDEIGQAIVDVLEENECTSLGKVMTKLKLFPKIVKCCKGNRFETIPGIGEVSRPPAIKNSPVKPVDLAFLLNHWSEARDRLAERKVDPIYIVWGATVVEAEGGIRIGTQEEYEKLLPFFRAIARGITDSHNGRVELVNSRGAREQLLSTGLLADPSPRDEDD